MDSPRTLVLGPGGAGDVAAHDGLEGQDRVLADLHCAVLEGGTEGSGDAGGQGGGEEVGFEVWEFGGDEGEPVRGELGEEGAFGGDALVFIC